MSLDEYHSSYVAVRDAGDVVVAGFELSQLSDDENIEQLGRDLFALVDQYNYRRVVLDLSRVQYITSSVIGKFITLHRRLHRGQGVLVLTRVSPAVMDVLRTSRLDSYFRLCDEVDCAIEMARAG